MFYGAIIKSLRLALAWARIPLTIPLNFIINEAYSFEHSIPGAVQSKRHFSLNLKLACTCAYHARTT